MKKFESFINENITTDVDILVSKIKKLVDELYDITRKEMENYFNKYDLNDIDLDFYTEKDIEPIYVFNKYVVSNIKKYDDRYIFYCREVDEHGDLIGDVQKNNFTDITNYDELKSIYDFFKNDTTEWTIAYLSTFYNKYAETIRKHIKDCDLYADIGGEDLIEYLIGRKIIEDYDIQKTLIDRNFSEFLDIRKNFKFKIHPDIETEYYDLIIGSDLGTVI